MRDSSGQKSGAGHFDSKKSRPILIIFQPRSSGLLTRHISLPIKKSKRKKNE
jgi:hypothetical protein